MVCCGFCLEGMDSGKLLDMVRFLWNNRMLNEMVETLTVVAESNAFWVVHQEMRGGLAHKERGHETSAEIGQGKHCIAGN